MSKTKPTYVDGRRFVKPGEGRQPRHPELGRRIAKAGEPVKDTPILRRMLRDGDLVDARPLKASKTAAKTGAKQ